MKSQRLRTIIGSILSIFHLGKVRDQVKPVNDKSDPYIFRNPGNSPKRSLYGVQENPIFIPGKHTVMTYGTQRRLARKRRNIKKAS